MENLLSKVSTVQYKYSIYTKGLVPISAPDYQNLALISFAVTRNISTEVFSRYYADILGCATNELEIGIMKRLQRYRAGVSVDHIRDFLQLIKFCLDHIHHTNCATLEKRYYREIMRLSESLEKALLNIRDGGYHEKTG